MMTKIYIGCFLFLCLFTLDAQGSNFDLRGFLQRVIKSNLRGNKSKFKKGCSDDYGWCKNYKDYCSHLTVKTYCKRTCGTCPPPRPKMTTCKNERNCKSIKQYCMDVIYKTYMKNRCAATCGYCGQESIECGVAKRRKNKRTNFIVGGKKAKKGFYPWQVAIYYEDDFLCGGSLIDNKHILTAAHCFRHLSQDTSLYKVVLGDHNRAVKEGTEEERKVKKIVQHESYQYQADFNDIALMELDSKVVFGANINAICLPEVNEILQTGSKCFLSGWGRIRNDGESVNLLQHVALPIANREHCKERNTFNNRIVNNRMICAGYNDGLHYSSGCFGDSGGPLSCEQPDGSWNLYGVVSWGSSQCNGLDRYTVFTRVSKYVTWIKGHKK